MPFCSPSFFTVQKKNNAIGISIFPRRGVGVTGLLMAPALVFGSLHTPRVFFFFLLGWWRIIFCSSPSSFSLFLFYFLLLFLSLPAIAGVNSLVRFDSRKTFPITHDVFCPSVRPSFDSCHVAVGVFIRATITLPIAVVQSKCVSIRVRFQYFCHLKPHLYYRFHVSSIRTYTCILRCLVSVCVHRF